MYILSKVDECSCPTETRTFGEKSKNRVLFALSMSGFDCGICWWVANFFWVGVEEKVKIWLDREFERSKWGGVYLFLGGRGGWLSKEHCLTTLTVAISLDLIYYIYIDWVFCSYDAFSFWLAKKQLKFLILVPSSSFSLLLLWCWFWMI